MFIPDLLVGKLSKYVYPNVFMSIDDTNKVSQYDTDIKKYAEQKKADWI